MAKLPTRIGFVVVAAALLASPASASSVGWTRAVPEYDFVAFGVGYGYHVPVGPWKRSVIAPVDQFNPGHGIGIGIALQGRWFRFGVTVDYGRPSTEEWKRYVSSTGSEIDSIARFWYLGVSVGVNPWYTRRSSVSCAFLLGALRPKGRDAHSYRYSVYHFLSDGKYSLYVGVEVAVPLRLGNQFYVVPSVTYLSAGKTTFSNHENHRVNNVVSSIKFEWRVPMSLF